MRTATLLRLASFFIGTSLLASHALALEYPMGAPQQRFGMEIAGVYLQPISMEPEGMMRKAEESDVHMEADIKALANNPNGFPEGAWIPYLVIKFEVTKQGTNQKVTGNFMPMVANDGPHYGDNVKLFGPGKYTAKFTIAPPENNGHTHFGRHTDRQTGVRPWFKPFEVVYNFTFAGIGKKGGY